MDFGAGDLRKLLLTFVCSIPTPHPTVTQQSPRATKKHENRAYDQEVEHTTFTPLVLSATGGQATVSVWQVLQDQPTIQPNHKLVKMPSFICSPQISNSMY